MSSFSPDTGGTLDTSLVSFWKLDGDSTDELGAYDGTDTNVTYSSTNALLGERASMSATGNIALGNVTKTAAWSVSLWVRPSGWLYTGLFFAGTTATQYFFGIFGRENGSRVMQGYVSDGTSNKIVDFTDSSFAWNNTNYPSTSWTHLVLTCDNSSMKMYRNGTASAVTGTITFTPGGTAVPTYIGAFGDGTLYRLNGLIDEVGLWSKVLTSTEVTDLYNSGAGNTYAPTASVNSNFFAFM